MNITLTFHYFVYVLIMNSSSVGKQIVFLSFFTKIKYFLCYIPSNTIENKCYSEFAGYLIVVSSHICKYFMAQDKDNMKISNVYLRIYCYFCCLLKI